MNALFLFTCIACAAAAWSFFLYDGSRFLNNIIEHTPQNMEQRAAWRGIRQALGIRSVVSLMGGVAGAPAIWHQYGPTYGAFFYLGSLGASALVWRLFPVPEYPEAREAEHTFAEVLYRTGYRDGLEWAQKLMMRGQAKVKNGQDPYRTGETVDVALQHRLEHVDRVNAREGQRRGRIFSALSPSYGNYAYYTRHVRETL